MMDSIAGVPVLLSGGPADGVLAWVDASVDKINVPVPQPDGLYLYEYRRGDADMGFSPLAQ